MTSLPIATQTNNWQRPSTPQVMGNLTVAIAAGQVSRSVHPGTNGIPTRPDQYGNPNTSVNNYITGTLYRTRCHKSRHQRGHLIWNSNTARIIRDQYSDDSKIVPAVTAIHNFGYPLNAPSPLAGETLSLQEVPQNMIAGG